MNKKNVTEMSYDMPVEAGENFLIYPYSTEIVENLCNLVRKGNHNETACSAVMINYESFKKCLVEGMDDAAKGKISPSYNLYMQIKKATAERQIYLNSLIDNCLNSDQKLVFKVLQIKSKQGNRTFSSTFDEFIINESNNFQEKIIQKKNLTRKELQATNVNRQCGIPD
jgi:hypothetical protein